MERKEVLKSPEYWTAKAQVDLYNQAQNFMKETGKNKSQLADYLGVSKGYVSQLLNGDYDHRLSKFFELALAFGVVPQIDFVPIDKCIKEDSYICKFKDVAIQDNSEYNWIPVDRDLTTPVTWNNVSSCEQIYLEPKKTA